MFNSSLRYDLTHLPDINFQNRRDLDNDISRSLKSKVIIPKIGLLIYGFLLRFNSNMAYLGSFMTYKPSKSE